MGCERVYLAKGKDIRNVYSDESCPRGKHAFGALICTPRRAEILAEQTAQIRKQYGFDRELKWNNIYRKTIDIANAFVLMFLEDKYSKFYAMQIIQGNNWSKWQKSNESRFFKSYYVFLRRITNSYYRYDLYVDKRSSKPSRWITLQYLNNKMRKADYQLRHNNFRRIIPTDSKENDLLQIVDLLLGACVLTTEHPVKVAFQKMIVQHPTYTNKVHIIEPFSPYSNHEFY